ncbi:MAG: two-component sensor histidine kinase [Acidobacteria bacterium]|nr:MAG: two-component sensor histidine kinase [Acidobacteriota bacterium]PYV76782.1 MAG: two-component sensor histidine kinase [Acidobacteriota bacterium]
MRVTRRGKIIFFLTLTVCLAAASVAVGFGWIILNWQQDVKVVLGIIFFGAIIAGLILNTSFLIREIRRNEQHDSFINAVTHELKTPITSIRLHLQTLERRKLDDAQRQTFYRLMLEDSDRLMNTVEQVLKASRAGARKGEHIAVDFAQLVEQCVENARTSHHLQPDALRYQSELNGKGSEVRGDPGDLRTAVSNILDNAVKYSGSRIDISVRLEEHAQNGLALRVQDRGVGIPPNELKTVFKRFYRVPNRTLPQVRGTGLGLFLVRTIAKRHGGRVSAQSAGQGKGTTVIFELPRSVA